MESSKSASTVRHVGVLLSNFSANITELDIGEGFFLTTLSGEEEELLSSAKSLVGPFVGLSPFERFTAVLKASYSKTGSEPDETSSEHVSRATAAITALRLVKSGPVGSPGIIVRGRLGGGGMVLFTPVDEWRVPGGGTYTLEAAETPRFLSLLADVRQQASAKKGSSIDTGLRRFNLAYSRANPEDRLIDLTITLESTLLYDTRDELAHRLGLRGAALLAGACDPLETYGVLQAIYRARSKIVHSGLRLREMKWADLLRNLKVDVGFSELPQKCEELTRAVLRSYLRLMAEGESLRDITCELDSVILQRLKL